MKTFLSNVREAGSFIAGLLIGLAIVVPVFAMTAAQPGDWQRLWIYGAPIVLALGLVLQVVATAKPRRRRTPEPVDAAVPFVSRRGCVARESLRRLALDPQRIEPVIPL